MFILPYEWNEMTYVWMNEAYSVFSKEGSLVEIQNVEPLFLGSLDVKSMIQRYHGIWTNDMENVMSYMHYVMCYVQDVMCCVQNVMYDDACYSHGMTFLIQIWKVQSLFIFKFGKLTNFPNPDLASPLTWLSIIMLLERSILTHACPWCVLAYTHT